jgi:hypothetical protein
MMPSPSVSQKRMCCWMTVCPLSVFSDSKPPN